MYQCRWVHVSSESHNLCVQQVLRCWGETCSRPAHKTAATPALRGNLSFCSEIANSIKSHHLSHTRFGKEIWKPWKQIDCRIYRLFILVSQAGFPFCHHKNETHLGETNKDSSLVWAFIFLPGKSPASLLLQTLLETSAKALLIWRWFKCWSFQWTTISILF